MKQKKCQIKNKHMQMLRHTRSHTETTHKNKIGYNNIKVKDL